MKNQRTVSHNTSFHFRCRPYPWFLARTLDQVHTQIVISLPQLNATCVTQVGVDKILSGLIKMFGLDHQLDARDVVNGWCIANVVVVIISLQCHVYKIPECAPSGHMKTFQVRRHFSAGT